MNKFFVTDKVYKERMSICKSCVYYSSILGQCKRCLCFMKIKTRIANLDCPEKYWMRTTEYETPEDLPEDIIEEILNVYPLIKSGRAKDKQAKKKMIELHNVIYGTNFSNSTNCGSCLTSCYEGIKLAYEKYKQKTKNIRKKGPGIFF